MAEEEEEPYRSTPSSRSKVIERSRKMTDNNKEGVTPELLVDALSGHEDGLLAIAEKLMEQYDKGYDVMGEAIIDAFADVQKLFQHVVEAAHMEGAAFEATRKDEEIAELRAQLNNAPTPVNNQESSPNTSRHDEFIDQDVKDILNDAIRQGQTLRDANKNMECYEFYEQACQSASALLPVDSDHRGRLQLSIARAESMSPERACAILRYAMDDVLRSGIRAARTPLPDPSKRADVVLSRSNTGGQSPDEALSSLTDEMKEILSAPVYHETPLQSVSQRFWNALEESQKYHQKHEEKLEQNLGKLKGDFLLARAEWEEKLNRANETSSVYRHKYEKIKDQVKNESYMDQARAFVTRSEDETGVRAQSVASLGSGLAQHAKTLVQQMNQFNCAQPGQERGAQRNRTPPRGTQKSRSFQDYSRSPQRVDV